MEQFLQAVCKISC